MISAEDFLTILVAQLEYQDPLDPQDPTEFVSELAQLTQVSYLSDINDSLTSMQTANTTAQWMSVIGKKVDVSSSTLSTGDTITLIPQDDYDTVTMTLTDQVTGDETTVTYAYGDTLTYENTGDNDVKVTSVSVTLDGVSVDCNATVMKIVKGVIITDSGPTLYFADGESVAASDVTAVQE